MGARITRGVSVKLSTFPVDSFRRVAEEVMAHVKGRIQRGVDIYDRPAPPLKLPTTLRKDGTPYKSYGQRKVEAGGRNLRDWTRPVGMFKGRTAKATDIRGYYACGVTMRTMAVTSVTENRAIISFSSQLGYLRAVYNNRRWMQFEMSPNDHLAFGRALQQYAYNIAQLRTLRQERILGAA